MARLSDFLAYLQSRRGVVERVEKQLCALQEKYETFFRELDRAREAEFDQLRGHIVAGYDGLPPALRAELDEARRVAAEDLDRQLAALAARHAELGRKAEKERAASQRAETGHRKLNQDLDVEEEGLKARNEELLARIRDYNDRIRSLSRGFGFFVNLFRMRRLQRERVEIDREQADLAARIEAVRARWVSADEERAKKEAARQAAWVKLKTDADAVAAKLDHLRTTGAVLVDRTALELVLFARKPELQAPREGDPACPRCGKPNRPDSHFCHICAHRLRDDRPDLAGSLLEVAELNHHHERFAAGVKACQELIGLVRGLGSGIAAFSKSVADVQRSESKYPLPKLQIDVPPAARSWGQHLDTLLQRVSEEDASVHPKVFADDIQEVVATTFTEKAIQRWFESMGEELSRQAAKQW
jgi:hypothetical protein